MMKLLHVEDNDLEALKIERGLASLAVAHEIVRARDGIEALEWMGEALHARYLVLLDLNLPRMNGLEFLEAREQDPALAPMPVFVLSTSSRQSDIDRCYQYSVSGYLVKPATMPAMADVLSTLVRFWSLCRLPSASGTDERLHQAAS